MISYNRRKLFVYVLDKQGEFVSLEKENKKLYYQETITTKKIHPTVISLQKSWFIKFLLPVTVLDIRLVNRLGLSFQITRLAR